MYLTQAQLETLLQTSYFTEPITQRTVQYKLYQGHLNATVHTLRFSINVDKNDVLQHIIDYLMKLYDLNTQFLASISYDLVLVDPKSNPKSYYIWRANSNASIISALSHETFLPLTYDNLYRFVNDSVFNNQVSDFDIFFASSSVVVDRILAIVITFVKL